MINVTKILFKEIYDFTAEVDEIYDEYVDFINNGELIVKNHEKLYKEITDNMKEEILSFYKKIESDFPHVTIEVLFDNHFGLSETVEIDKDFARELIDGFGFYDPDIIDIDPDEAKAHLITCIDDISDLYGMGYENPWNLKKLFEKTIDNGIYPRGTFVEENLSYVGDE